LYSKKNKVCMRKKVFLITPSVQFSKKKKVYQFSIEKNWFDYCNKINIELIMYDYLRPDKINNLDGVIFSGGNDLLSIERSDENYLREKNELFLLKQSLKKRKKIIGVCKGFQLLNNYFNGSIIRTKNHVKTMHKIDIYKNKFLNKTELNVNSFHKYKILKLSKNLEKVAYTKDQSVEIAINYQKKILCLMFHPERENKSQKNIDVLIKNFIHS
jgi:gamma-glutamyl-gamma-aminobutyrate hydrolase PuuD